MKKIVFLIFAFGSFACELEPSLEQYVVDTWLNNSPGSQKIFLSRSSDYFSVAFPTLLSGAEVYVIDEDGNRFDFEETDEGYVWGDSLSTSFTRDYLQLPEAGKAFIFPLYI